jgi:hypothetical protein
MVVRVHLWLFPMPLTHFSDRPADRTDIIAE